MTTPLSIVMDNLVEIRSFADTVPQVGLFHEAAPLVDRLCGERRPETPMVLRGAQASTLTDYHANWDHQTWYHLSELLRVAENRRQRAAGQGGDTWVSLPAPPAERQAEWHLLELAKLRALFAADLRLVPCVFRESLVHDRLMDQPGLWEFPAALELERHDEQGVCWQGQNPGGDWLWLAQPLPAEPVSICFDMQPVSTIKGGLIAAFCASPVKPGTPLSAASSPSMADYYNNFNAYHFSVNRGSTGYCNLRRCGPGLVMLASFADPCPQYGRWYALEILKDGPQVELRVDGRVAACYVDLGFIQPALDGGFFGLRHFQGFRGWHRNVRIATLEPTP